ncbi:MAG: HAD family hydrolase [Thalassolituus sp.]
MTIKLITLDLDHTIWNPTQALINAEHAVNDWISNNSPVTAEFYPPAKIREYKEQIVAAYPEFRHKVSELRFQVLRRVFLQSGHDSDTARAMASEAFDVFYQARSTGLELFEQVADVLTALKSKHAIVAVTNGNADLDIAGHRRFFDAHYRADDFDQPKPAPDMFLQAMQDAGVTPEETLHIGDHPEQDIAAANALGLKTVWFNEKGSPWPPEFDLPDAEFSHWSQLAQLVSALADS